MKFSLKKGSHLAPMLALFCFCVGQISVADEQTPQFDSPEDAADFELQGEYTGQFLIDDVEAPFGVQVVARGDREFTFVAYPGGLPGSGWNGDEKITVEGTRTGKSIAFSNDCTATIQGNEILPLNPEGSPLGRIKKVHRKSPTLGEPAPPNAIVLFDGANADAFENGEMTDEGLLKQGVTSHETFQDFRLHMEFRTPYKPKARGQDRGNSGAYMQGRYEVQILDSFGLEGEDNECGGIYHVKAPLLNMAYPPLTWQTYDIEFTAPRYDKDGHKTQDAQVTVRHNGVLVQNKTDVPEPTRSARLAEDPQPGPLYLQNHSNPVRYQNIWIVRHPRNENESS